jgi:hypothetical protein
LNKIQDFKSFLSENKQKTIFSYRKPDFVNSLYNSVNYNFVDFASTENKNTQESGINLRPASKKRRIIADDDEEENNNFSHQQNTSQENCKSKSNKKKVNKFPKVQELSEFLESPCHSDSAKDEVSLNDTRFSSTSPLKLNNNTDPNYLIYEQMSGYISDNAIEKFFTPQKRKYASDDEDYIEKSVHKKEKKIVIFKYSKKNTKISDNIKTFNIFNSDYKKLKRELLNRKTKRDEVPFSNKKAPRQMPSKSYNNISNNNNNIVNSSKKSKVKAMVANIMDSDEEKSNNKPRSKKNVISNNDNYNEIKGKKSKRSYFKEDDKSSVSNISSFSAASVVSRKRKAKEYANNIKNYFSIKFDKSIPLVNLNSKFENRTTKINTNKNNVNKSLNNSIMSAFNNKSNSILTYFPQVSNVNTKREGEILKNLSRLINNGKYTELLNLLDKDPQRIYYQLISDISSKHSELINKSNDIDSELIETIFISEMNFKIEEKTFDFLNDSKKSILMLFEFYKQNLSNLMSILHGEEISNSVNNITDPNEYLFKIVNNVKTSENLIKYIIKNHEKISNLNFSNFKSEICNIFLIFLTRLFTMENINDEIYEEIKIDRLVAFLMILKVMFSIFSIKKETLSMDSLKEVTTNFIKIVVYLVLSKLFWFNTKNLIENLNQVVYMSLIQILTDVYSTLHSINEKDSNALKLLDMVFKDFFYTGASITGDFQVPDIKAYFLDTCKKYFNGNFFDSNSFEKNMKSSFYKIFILQTNSISHLNEVSADTKKLIFNPLLLQLYHRYFNLFLLMFCEGGKVKWETDTNSLFKFFEEYYSIICKENSLSYYDFDTIIKSVDNIEVKRILFSEIKGNMLRKYLLSDTNTLLILESIWKIEDKLKLKIIFKFLASLVQPSRKNIISEEEINKKNLYSVIDIIFTSAPEEGADISTLNTFILNICKIVRNILVKDRSDDITRKQLLSIFVQHSKNKIFTEIAQSANTYENKLGIIPTFTIVLCLIEFKNIFEINENIELSVKKISEIFESNKTSTLMKAFNIAILLRVVMKLSKRKLSITKYVDLICQNIKTVLVTINELNQQLNMDNNEKIREEHSRTIEYFLKIFIQIAREDPNVIINNPQILEEMKNIVSSDSMNKTCKRMVFIIIELILSKFEELVIESNKENEKSKKVETIVFEGMELDLDFDDMFPEEENEKNEINYSLNNFQTEFLNKLKNNFVTIIPCMIQTFFLPSNSKHSNIHNRHKISLELLQIICDVYPKLAAILIKYSSLKPSDFFTHFSSKSNFFSNTLVKENCEIITFIPFKAFTTFLNFNKNFLKDLSIRRDYKHFQHFIKLFFYAILFNFNFQSRKNNYGMMTIRSFNSENEKFMKELYEGLVGCRSLIEENLNKIKNDFENKLNVSDHYREESSYYNILLYIIDNFSIATNALSNFDEIFRFFSGLLELVTINKNLSNIESRFLFDLLIGIKDIITRNINFDPDNKILYSQTIRNVYFRIMNKFGTEFTSYKLDQISENFMRELSKFILMDNFGFGYNNSEIDFHLLCNDDFKMFLNSLIICNKVDRNKEFINVYLNEYIKYLKNEISSYYQNNKFTNVDIDFNLVVIEYLSNCSVFSLSPINMTLEVYYYLICTTLEEILKLEDSDLIFNYYTKLITKMRVDTFTYSLRTDTILHFHTLILQRILIFFDLEAEVNKDRQFPFTFIYKVYYLCVSELFNIAKLCLKENFEKFKPKINKILQSLCFEKRDESKSHQNNFTPNESIITNYLSFSNRIIQILKEFYYDNSEINESLITISFIYREISNTSKNNEKKIISPLNVLNKDFLICDLL